MAENSKKSTRDKAAAARAEQLAAEKKRERLIRLIGVVVVVVVVGGIIGLTIFATKKDGGSGGGSASPTANPSAALPKGVQGPDGQFPYSVPVGNADSSKPTLVVWEDFQCPACKQMEDKNGAGIEDLGTSGKAQLFYRPTTFLDQNLKNDSSSRAVSAWGCAIDQGKTLEYHNTVYANQPAKEGEGYTDAQLLQFGKDSGITGPAYDTFAKCVADKTYLGWAANSYDAFVSANIPGTPAVFLNGTEVPASDAADKAKLDALVAAATK